MILLPAIPRTRTLQCRHCAKMFTALTRCGVPPKHCSRACRRAAKLEWNRGHAQRTRAALKRRDNHRCIQCKVLVSKRRDGSVPPWCARCVRRHMKPRAAPVAVPQAPRPRRFVAAGFALDTVHDCGEKLLAGSNPLTGVMHDWCPKCRVEIPIPVRGMRTHDQRAKLEKAMGIRVASESSAITKPVSHKGKHRIAVGKNAA
jgi:hypothetical protein